MSSAIYIPIISMAGLALFMALLLGFAHRKLKVEEDPRVEQVTEILPNVSCGACGFAGCRDFADRLIKGDVELERCTVAGEEETEEIADLLGIERKSKQTLKARVLCGGGKEEAQERAAYFGARDCEAAVLAGGGGKACLFGCLGYANCVRACPFDAIHMDDNGLPVVSDDKCVACGLCVPACPRDLIELHPIEREIFVLCSSVDKGGVTRRRCKVGCFACGLCVKACPTGAMTLVDNLARIDYEKCDACEACIDVCPAHTIKNVRHVRVEAAEVGSG